MLLRLADLAVEGGTPVLVRVDFNVPLANGEVADDARIRAAVPTIAALREKGAKVILCSHLGRPRGQRNPTLSLEPVGVRLAEILDDEIWFAHDTVGDDVEELIKELPAGGVLLLENLRFNRGEMENEADFSARLGRLARHYVNDAFASIHRNAASIVGVVQHMDSAAMGLLVEQELNALGRLQAGPDRPYVAVLGGARVTDKMTLIESLARRCDSILLGGPMSYTFLAAQGKKVGKSKIEADRMLLARRVLERCAERSVNVYLPFDHVVGEEPTSTEVQVVKEIPDDLCGIGIGPETVTRYQSALCRAATVFWDGAMSLTEANPQAVGTQAIATCLAENEMLKVVSGADATAAVKKLGLAERFTHLSTGGSATLEYLEGKELPGIRALRQRSGK